MGAEGKREGLFFPVEPEEASLELLQPLPSITDCYQFVVDTERKEDYITYMPEGWTR